jgi:hypothetical protein
LLLIWLNRTRSLSEVAGKSAIEQETSDNLR